MRVAVAWSRLQHSALAIEATWALFSAVFLEFSTAC
jgi:hypothetical protein